MNEMKKLMEAIEKINESFSGKTYDQILDGYEVDSPEEALKYAGGIVWSEIETTHNDIKYARLIGRVDDTDVYYDYGADYYFFAPIDIAYDPQRGDDEAMLEQAANPVDTVTLDIPLLIRILEFSREDAQTDMDLHSLTDNLINLSPEGNTLTMADYEELIAGLAGKEDETDVAYDPQPGDEEPLKHGWSG